MSSIGAPLDEFEAAHSRFLSSRFDSLTPSELLAILERYTFLMGRLEALRYELTSPFVRPSRNGLNIGGPPA